MKKLKSLNKLLRSELQGILWGLSIIFFTFRQESKSRLNKTKLIGLMVLLVLVIPVRKLGVENIRRSLLV